MTLKLLVANLKLDIIIFILPEWVKLSSKTNDFSELIVQTKSFFVEFYKHSDIFKDKIKELVINLFKRRIEL